MSNKSMCILFVLLQMFGGCLYAADVFKGQEIYVRECSVCHGANGEGKLPGLLNFKESQALFKTDRVLVGIVRDGKGTMPSFSGLLSGEDIRNVVVYLRTFL